MWIRAGEYPQAQIGPDNDDLDEPVVMRPDDGAKVTLAGLVTYGGRLTLRDVTIATEGRHQRGWINEGASDVRLDGVDITGPWANLRVAGRRGQHLRQRRRSGRRATRGRASAAAATGEPVELTLTKGMTISNVDFQPFQPDRRQSRCAARTTCSTWRRSASTTASTTSCSSAAASTAATARAPRGSSSPSSSRRARGRTPTGSGWSTTGSAPPRAPTSILLGENQICAGYVFAYNLWEGGFDDACRQGGRRRADLRRQRGHAARLPARAPAPRPPTTSGPGPPAGRDCGTDTWAIDPCNCLDGLGLAGDGFHLTAASPAVDAGQPEAECKRLTGGVDIDGEPRRGTCDAGPDELATESR